MLRLIGSLVIIFGSGAFGLLMAQRYTLRPKHIRMVHQVLSALETEISYGQTPLPQALQSAAKGVTEPVAGFVTLVSEQIILGTPAGTAWEQCCRQWEEKLCLNNDDWLILHNVGIGLGTTDRVEEKKKLNLACARLESAEREAAVQGQKLAKIWGYLGFMAGIAITLLIV